MYQLDVSKNHNSYYMEVQLLPNLIDFVLQAENVAVKNKFTLKEIVTK